MSGELHISRDMSKVKRSISGIYFRYKNDAVWENWCFEDLPGDEQDNVLRNKSHEFVVNLAKQLAVTINGLSDNLDITYEHPDEDNSY